MLVMLFSSHQPADVVQQRAIFDDLALASSQPVQRLELIKKPRTQFGHLLAVGLLPVATAGQIDHAAAPRLRDFAPHLKLRAIAGQIIDQQAFAQRRTGNPHALDLQFLKEPVDQQRAGDDLVFPAVVEPFNFGAILRSALQ